jgi:hypothetical protein
MGRIDFVVPVRPDQQQLAHIGLGQKIRDQIERCRIEPLQIIEEQGKRMLGPREHSDKPPKDELEPTLGVLRRKIGNRRRFPDDELQFRNQVCNEPAVRAPMLAKSIQPIGHCRQTSGAARRADRTSKVHCYRQ